ncbi:MAG: nucleoside deaminase [Sediminicola sp.]|tara:strand:- start:51492 stop:51968 length:477 start_codon:yes stop_codon:yes gene_type:complete
MTEKDEFFIKRAISLAQEGMRTKAGGPFGAVIVKDGHIVAEGYNMVTATNDPTAHAEVVAIRKACQALGSFQLVDCTIYTSCEPCPMCLGAIYWARPKNVVYACNKEDAAAIGFDDRFIYEELDRNMENRKITFVQMFQKEGRSVFREWEHMDHKIGY